jgi:hypothetical protein
MSYRHNPHGYYDNPRADDDEAESQRVMAVVQHVLDRVSRREAYHAFHDARDQRKLKQLIADALKIMQARSFPKKFIEVASAALLQPANVSLTFGVSEAYYLDGDKPPYSSDNDPGVLVDRVSDHKMPLAEKTRAPRRGIGPGVVHRRLHSTDFLTLVWPRVTDSDVQNAVAILQEEGISFYRKYKISEDDWVALHGPDSVEDYTGSRYVKKAARSRDEFLRSYVSSSSDNVLRVNVGRVVRELRDIDLEPDDVVYRHAGTNNSIGGNSARGFYVAQLREGQLVPEGMSPPVGLGICIGGEGYRESVRNGRMQIYGIRAPSGKPKFAISVDDTGIEQVKGAANRLPGFDPGSGEFKGEAGVDEVRAVVEFLMIFLGMKPQDEAFEGPNLEPGILAMRRAGIDPFSPPVKGQTWERAWERAQKERQASMEEKVKQYIELEVLGHYHDTGVATFTLSEAEYHKLNNQRVRLYNELVSEPGYGYPALDRARAEIWRRLGIGFAEDEEAEEAEAMPWEVPEQVRRLPPPPARRQNPDPLASYSDPEVAALALAAYERPMGGMWTYEDEDEE